MDAHDSLPPPVSDLPHFRHVFAHASSGMLLLAEDGRTILDANPKATELLATKRADLLGRDLADFIERNLDELTLFTRTVVNHGVAWTDTLAWSAGGDGAVTVAVTASGFEGPLGRRILLTLHEPTTAQHQEGGIQQALDQANYFRERINRYRRSVANLAAHEFNTPLTTLLVQIMLLEKNLGSLLGDGDRKRLKVILNNLKRLEQSVARFVQFASEDEED